MNKLDTQTRVQIVKALVDGVGINATCRIVGVAKNTVLKLLAELGEACARYHDEHVRNVKAQHIQCDEIWRGSTSTHRGLHFSRCCRGRVCS
jgi:hypothetical protein